ncbi:integrase [Gryllus bimaculatus nudivirus]|uniref:Integrase n=1 Tax=Gryllus bimaculatus nudivirus TaxID=432587 RepID=A4L220_9VIRU|nr:integrase [Gryllus bimaculatus nudivirus]ABO45390.1 integrase [Gryllus bimaculatus nudivirus]
MDLCLTPAKNVISKRKITKINEENLNSILDNIPDASFAEIIRKKLPKPNPKNVKRNINKDLKIPNIIFKIIKSIKLLDEPNKEQRLKLFIGYCKYKNYSYNTTLTYINFLKKTNIINKQNNIIPDKGMYNKDIHQRIIDSESFKKYFQYLLTYFNKFTAPLLFACFTGLRTMEILQVNTFTLFQLLSKKPEVSILRKNEQYWKPLYTNQFNIFIEKLKNLYKNTYNNALENNSHIKLFNIHPSTLDRRMGVIYYNATNLLLPFGAGIHTHRYMIANLLANSTKNIEIVSAFLQHKSIETTQIYLKSKLSFIEKEFQTIVNKKFNPVSKLLKNE